MAPHANESSRGYLPAILSVFAVLVSCLPGFLRSGAGGGNLRGKYAGTYRVTLYWVVDERDPRYTKAPGRVPILDPGGRVIKRVSRRFKQDLDMEGTGRLRDGRTVNFHCTRDGSKRFIVTSSAYGLAADGRPLVPFESVAADTRRIPAGTLLYIPRLAGMKLPGGSTHNGVVCAHDTGQAIKGARLDLFIGARAAIDRVSRTGVTRSKGVEVYMLAPETPSAGD